MRANFDIILFVQPCSGGDTIAAKNYVMNEMIRHKEVRVIDSDGSQVGILPTQAAIAKAYEKGMDLILIAIDGSPPVCRIADFGKLRYEQVKKEKKSKKATKGGHIKEIKLSAKIGDHDFLVKADRAKEFLGKGYKVKVSLMFRGREMTHPDVGRRHLDRMIAELSEFGKPDNPYTFEGRNMILIMSPK